MHTCGHLDMLGVLTGLDHGSHVKSPFCDVFSVKALKLVPQTPGIGFIAIDGELFPSQEITVEVLPSLATVFMPKIKDAAK